MYPFEAVLIGCSEAESSAFRQLLGDLPIRINGDFGNVQAAIEGRPNRLQKACFFIRINSASDLDQIRHLQRASPGSLILALINSDCDTQALLATQRAGAAQTVSVPLDPDDFQEALETMILQFGLVGCGPKTVIVLGITEMAGASSLAINLAYEIASQHSRPCILAELTSGMGRLATYLDIEPARTSQDLLDESMPLDIPSIRQSLVELEKNLLVLAGPYRGPSTLTPYSTRVSKLIDYLRRLAEVLVLDMRLDFGRNVVAELTNADHALLIGEPTVPSVHDLKCINESMQKEGVVAVRHVVINHFDSTDEQFARKRLREIFPGVRLWTIADDVSTFKTALNEGKPIRQVAPHSRALHDIGALASGLIHGKEPPLTPTKHHWFSSLWG